MGDVLTDPRLDITNPSQFSISVTNDLCVLSNGVSPTGADAFMRLNYSVATSWSFRVDAIFSSIPVDFVNIADSHIYFGSTNSAGIAAGLFVSSAGLAYSGSVLLEGGVLHLGGSFQVIPGTAGLVTTDKLYRFQIVVDGVTSTTYIFMAEPLSTVDYETVQQLVAILPGIPNNGFVSDGTTISVMGNQIHPSSVCFTSLCLATGMHLQAPPPISEAGKDQSLRTCTLGQLDGSGSYDPEGGALSYSWRLIDAPVGSSFEVEGGDGFTVPDSPPNGFTDRFHSPELGDIAAVDPVVTGDVLLVGGVAYSVLSTGIDGLGYYVQLTDNVLVDDLLDVHFKLLRNRFLTGAATVRPTFFPDVPGIYKFDLVVFNGKYLSTPTYVIVNVLESQVPKGCAPDLSFVWQYLSDFWKLVDDRERIQVFWEGMAQVVAAELLTLWQADYSKSLRDIQRTFQRRWLHYDLKLPEPAPDLTSIRQVYGSVDVSAVGNVFSGVQGTTLEILSPAHDPVTINFQAAGVYTSAVLQGILQRKLQWADSRYAVAVVFSSTPNQYLIRITAPFLFQIGGNTSTPYFVHGASNLPVSGTNGVRLAARTYLVEKSLQGLDIKRHDLLVIGGESYRIDRVVSDVNDLHPYQRVILESDLPLLPGTSWTIPSYAISRLLNFYNGLLSNGDISVLEVFNPAGVMSLMPAPILGACAEEVGKIAIDLTGVYPFLSQAGVSTQLAYVKRRVHVPIGSLVSDIPCLQEQIRELDDGAVLRRNVDFFIEKFRGQNSIRFAVGSLTGDPGDVWEGSVPPDRMWAETTYLDNRPTIEANFGIPAEFTLDQLADLDTDLDYLSAVQGLWYAYLNGPTMFNMRAGVQILLGLPFAEEQGTIEEIRTEFSVSQGRLLLRDVANPAIVRSYTYPNALPLEINPSTKLPYAVGDVVQQLAPMVQGSEILDYVKNPSWFQGLLSQGNFLEVEKFHKFMVRVDSTVFSLSSLMFVMSFILRIKPTYTRPIFVVKKTMDVIEVDVEDTFVARGRLVLNAGACFPNFGASQIFDDYSPASYGVRNQFDADSDQSTPPPVYPTPDTGITWGFDKIYLCPEDVIVFLWCIDHPGGSVSYDSGFSFDGANRPSHVFSEASITEVDNTGFTFSTTSTVVVTGTVTKVHFHINGDLGPDPGDYLLSISVNGTPHSYVLPLIGPGGTVMDFVLSLAVTAGDVLGLALFPSGLPNVRHPNWSDVTITLYQDPIPFAFDDGLPAGTYCFEQVT
jgi:hypothetical protein